MFSLSDVRLLEFNYSFTLNNASVVHNYSWVANLETEHEAQHDKSTRTQG